MRRDEPGDGRGGSPAMIPNDKTPLARVLAHEAAYWTCVSEAEPRAGWTLFHNVALLGRIDPNHAGVFRAAEGTGAAITRAIVDFYEGLGATPAAYVDALATPRDLVPSFLAAGFREWVGATSDLMLYVGPYAERPSAHAVAEVRTSPERIDWATVIEDDADAPTVQALHRLAATELADSRVTAFLARVDGRPVSRCLLFSSSGLGRVEGVRTLTAYQGRGLAAAVVRRAVAESVTRGNDLTYIYAEPNGAAGRLYDRLGFRTVARNAIQGFIQ